MTEKELKEVMVKEENRIIKDLALYFATHEVKDFRDYNKLTRLAMRRFYKEVVYPHLRELNINAPRKYEE